MRTFITVVAITLTAAAVGSGQTIVCPQDAPPNVKLAAKEIRRYVYLRTGTLLPLGESGKGIVLKVDPALDSQQYRLKPEGDTLSITGGSDVAVLYGAYRYAELLGVRFYLDGDVIPDERLKELPAIKAEDGRPLFDTRGIQPFHDFLEGSDWWNTDDYKAYATQMARLRMNFLGLHNYPERAGNWPGPEPTVWIGLPRDADDKGQVSYSYPAFFANTQRPGWGNVPALTSQFAGGAAALFETDAFGPVAQAGHFPWPKNPDECNEVFNRTAAMYRDAFGFARSLGIKICVGTETPLTVPRRVAERLKAAGKNPADPAVVRELYRGTFQRIARAFPVDYYWLWTPEGWTWSGNNPAEFEATRRDIQAALDALKDLGHPFALATCGWVLGPAHDRAALDALLPSSSPMSCINQQLGHAGVEPAFANVTGRPKWAIPWMENDPNMVGPQPWVARMRYDAMDARRFGCTGLLGIHWRIKAMQPNVAALAAAAWDQSWVPATFDATPVKSTKGNEGALGGAVTGFTAPVADTGNTPQSVYQDVRFDFNGYTLTIPDGTYTVTLQFNEPFYTAAGKRVFGVKVQGKQVLDHLDMFTKVGRNKALDLSFPGIVVTNGTLKIEFAREVEHPCIAGIVIAGKTKAVNQLTSEAFTRKINCGGGAVGDYEADKVSGGTQPLAGRGRAMPIADFYDDYARVNFGNSAVGAILAKIDGNAMPEVSGWIGDGPGGLPVNGAPWSAARTAFAFVGELEALRPQIKGAGNLARFDYWLNTYRGAAAMAEVSCLHGLLDRRMAAKKHDEALVTRIELAKAWTRLMTLQTSIVSTPGELGTIANLEQHTRRRMQFIEGHDAALAKALGKPLPPEAQPGMDYAGPARLIVPTVRSVVVRGESLRVKIITLPATPPTLHIRPLGKGPWQTIPATHIARSVYEVQLPAAQEDFEYYITADNLKWPATAPSISHTIVIQP